VSVTVPGPLYAVFIEAFSVTSVGEAEVVSRGCISVYSQVRVDAVDCVEVLFQIRHNSNMKRRGGDAGTLKPLYFLEGAYDDLMELPETVRRDFGYGLYLVQRGEMPDNASPFEGSMAGSIMKLVERHDTDTYRCVFAAKFGRAIYVLHVFKKKSTAGIATPQREIETVRARFGRAQVLYAREFGEESPPAHRPARKGKP